MSDSGTKKMLDPDPRVWDFETEYELGQDNIRPLGLDIHNPVFVVSGVLILGFVIAALANQDAAAAFFGWLEARMDDVLAHDADALAHIVRRSCEIKAAVVAQDERERGRCALLNLGHTFGHALESLSGYGRWLHGEAVAIGIMLAARTSAELGMIDAAHCERIGALLARAGLPVTAPGVQPEALLARMSLDKKASERGLSLVLLERIGRGVVVPAPDEALLRHVVRAQCQSAA